MTVEIRLADLLDVADTPKREPVDIGDLVAAPNFAPKAWQSAIDDGAWAYKPPVQDSPDLRRILALPRRPAPDEARSEALIELMTRRYALPEPKACVCNSLGRACITRLRIAQAWALFEIGLHGGLLGFIQVGAGKSALDLLAPLAFKGCRKALLLVPPSLVPQLVLDYRALAGHFRVPTFVVHTKSAERFIVPGAPELHVLPYSRLSRQECARFIPDLRPDVIIADECHRMKHADTSGTARLLKYMNEHRATRFAGWSGSLTDASIMDYLHLLVMAHRERSPLPTDPQVGREWATAVDPGDNPAPMGALEHLCEPGEHVQSGYRRRLLDTPGITASIGTTVDADLIVRPRQAPPIPPAVRDALKHLRDTWVRPDGEELLDALEVSRVAIELAQGFYYRWKFVNGETDEQILAWLAARKDWRSELREKLKPRYDHLDSEALCTNAAMRAHGDVAIHDKALPVWKASFWPRWRDIASSVKPITETIRLDEYLARDAASWALENRGIVWYGARAFGLWVSELSGLPMHGGGPQADQRIKAERGDRSIVASIKSHGTGRDGLQYLFAKALWATPAPSAVEWEQGIGRLLRSGQRAPLVEQMYYNHTEELRARFQSALERTEYVQRTTPYGAQRLLMGTR